MNKKVIGITIAVIIAVAGFIYATQPESPSEQSASAKPSSHIEGEGGKNITLIEYGDFQCPACAAYHPLIKAIVEKYKADIFFQFSNYPLEAIHTNARASARAAEAANMQGKFWEMHDMLYEQQKNWETVGDPLSSFKLYAQQIGISDIAKFEADYKSAAVNDIINADLKEGQKIDVTSTPTFVLDGVKITENPRDQDAFDKLIADAIAKKSPAQ